MDRQESPSPPVALDQVESTEKEQHSDVQDPVDATLDEKDSASSPTETTPSSKIPSQGKKISLLDLVQVAGGSDSAALDQSPRISQAEKNRVYAGICQWFDLAKGYGFIRVTDDPATHSINQDVYVHKRNVLTEDDSEDGFLEKNQECKFEISSRPPATSSTRDGASPDQPRLSAQNVVPGPKPKREKKPRHKGVCVMFDNSEGKKFGFIHVDGTDDEIFVHMDAVKHGKGLVEGQPCEFEIVEQQGGRLRAHNVNPGKAPPVDPEANKVRTGTVARWIESRGFGFIRPDKVDEQEVMVHRNNLKSSGGELVEGQFVKYKIRKRRPRRARAAAGDASTPKTEGNDDNTDRMEAVDVVPGEIPKRQVFQGIVKFFDKEEGFGFISRKGGKSEDYYVNKQQIVSEDEEVFLEEGQQVTFVPSIGRNRKVRAVEVVPGLQAEEISKQAESPDDVELPLGATDATNRNEKKKRKGKDAASPPPPPDDGLTEEERFKKDFNFRKKQRRKRAKERQALEAAENGGISSKSSPSSSSQSSSPNANDDSPRAARPTKKQKKALAKAQAQAQAQAQAEAQATARVQAQLIQEDLKEATLPVKPAGNQKKQKKAKPPQPQAAVQEESKVLFRKNKKQSKKKKRPNAAEMKRKRIEDAEKEQDAISDHFAKSAKLQNDGFLAGFYRWVLSFCKQS